MSLGQVGPGSTAKGTARLGQAAGQCYFGQGICFCKEKTYLGFSSQMGVESGSRRSAKEGKSSQWLALGAG